MVDDLLDRLDGVQERSYGEWWARCPVCGSPSPRLLIREDSDGQVDAHCKRGCSTSHILSGLGLPFAVLFPRDGKPYRPPIPAWWKHERRYAHGVGVVPPTSER
ncbi:hypothetical protein RN01_30385 [Cupriavidus sp. SHE]|uniref:Uncharacterized protein n=1 Tax=Cupriavidus metallidurans TaxID=119219 RepID=A0A2L0X3H6_9BURK|nr:MULTISPECIES: hypothetical protein [Cupriavidus]AVA34651.1 hypothetical protein C3Z06_14200 [Cupriavidus metallidurans]KWR74517.1 hypothetical protein RN01_30385 [Cupriavidus sp. SHE]QBP12302.1 hypothetical protein DDF84_021360 [Cupriavidus metallidurans]